MINFVINVYAGVQYAGMLGMISVKRNLGTFGRKGHQNGKAYLHDFSRGSSEMRTGMLLLELL